MELESSMITTIAEKVFLQLQVETSGNKVSVNQILFIPDEESFAYFPLGNIYEYLIILIH